MKVKELIEKLQKFDGELEIKSVEFSDAIILPEENYIENDVCNKIQDIRIENLKIYDDENFTAHLEKRLFIITSY